MQRAMKALGLALLLSVLWGSDVLASWAYAFVVNDGRIYQTTEEQVEEALIGKEAGQVTHSSDWEGTYSGNFSNVYPKGTRYFLIEGVSIEEAIAVRTPEGAYIKAVYEGRYEGKELTNTSAKGTEAVLTLVLFAGLAAALYTGIKAVSSNKHQ